MKGTRPLEGGTRIRNSRGSSRTRQRISNDTEEEMTKIKQELKSETSSHRDAMAQTDLQVADGQTRLLAATDGPGGGRWEEQEMTRRRKTAVSLF